MFPAFPLSEHEKPPRLKAHHSGRQDGRNTEHCATEPDVVKVGTGDEQMKFRHARRMADIFRLIITRFPTLGTEMEHAVRNKTRG